jgi:hypothetical protein
LNEKEIFNLENLLDIILIFIQWYELEYLYKIINKLIVDLGSEYQCQKITTGFGLQNMDRNHSQIFNPSFCQYCDITVFKECSDFCNNFCPW